VLHVVYIGLTLLIGGVLGAWVGSLVVARRARRQLAALAQAHADTVQLYLRRRLAEMNLDAVPLPPAPAPEVVLDNAVHMASRLLNHERKQIEMGDTQELGMASTLRIASEKLKASE
jgi:hypothetical protein